MSTSSPAPSNTSSPPKTPNPDTLSDSTTPHYHLPTQKLAALARFKSFTGGLGFNKDSKAKNKVVFPPPSWFIDDNAATPNNDENAVNDLAPDPAAPDQMKSSTNITAEVVEPPEPISFANKIRTLIDSLPLPPLISGQNPAAETGSSSAVAPPLDDKGPPIPSVVDAKLMKLLSSEDVMNGNSGESGNEPGPKRQSVWSALERMTSDRVGTWGRGIGQKVQSDNDAEGVMMYSPLEPKADSEVELAESELEYVDPDEWRAGSVVGKDKGKGKETEQSSTPVPKGPILEKRWVPSTTRISLFTTWWGYRLYLPPPVMATLNSGQLKTAKRAAMITAALKWLLDRVPLMMMPPQVRGIMVLLRRLTPLVGYIGIFVAWSWARITACDKGHGVVLTATWLLPVALIPMSWDAGDIHGPPVQPPPKEEKEQRGDKQVPSKGRS